MFFKGTGALMIFNIIATDMVAVLPCVWCVVWPLGDYVHVMLKMHKLATTQKNS